MGFKVVALGRGGNKEQDVLALGAHVYVDTRSARLRAIGTHRERSPRESGPDTVEDADGKASASGSAPEAQSSLRVDRCRPPGSPLRFQRLLLHVAAHFAAAVIEPVPRPQGTRAASSRQFPSTTSPSSCHGQCPIGIGDGQKAVPLPHHPACGTAPGGSGS
ncbi:hypothetical protein [Paraburkholderia fungorum]